MTVADLDTILPLLRGLGGRKLDGCTGTHDLRYGPASFGPDGPYGGAARRKKDCLFLTNKAVMLLKKQDRENERSRTKPILSSPKYAAKGCRGEMYLRGVVTPNETKGYGFFPKLALRFFFRCVGSE